VLAERRPRRIWVVLAGLLAQGCAVSGLSFAQDRRVRIESPASNDTVELPFEVRWTARDFEGTFVVLFDQSPMRPNQELRSLVPADDPCRAEPDCPNPEWLAERDIYVTSETSVLIDDLPDERSSNRSSDRHQLTIVLLDGAGRRVGESVFVREFIVERDE
jgi:hypothetical protein